MSQSELESPTRNSEAGLVTKKGLHCGKIYNDHLKALSSCAQSCRSGRIRPQVASTTDTLLGMQLQKGYS